MSLDALALPNGLSLVTIADREPPSWTALFPSRAQEHIPYRARTVSERNLLGARLDAAVTRADHAVLLVAQGAGCFAAAWWARLSPASYVARVTGALFFDPAEEDGADRDSFASPAIALPFPSIVLSPGTGSARLPAQTRALAETWGSRLVIAAESESDGPLARTRRVIERFTSAVVKRDVGAAERLIALSAIGPR